MAHVKPLTERTLQRADCAKKRITVNRFQGQPKENPERQTRSRSLSRKAVPTLCGSGMAARRRCGGWAAPSAATGLHFLRQLGRRWATHWAYGWALWTARSTRHTHPDRKGNLPGVPAVSSIGLQSLRLKMAGLRGGQRAAAALWGGAEPLGNRDHEANVGKANGCEINGIQVEKHINKLGVRHAHWHSRVDALSPSTASSERKWTAAKAMRQGGRGVPTAARAGSKSAMALRTAVGEVVATPGKGP
jgi:hypothetical protein